MIGGLIGLVVFIFIIGLIFWALNAFGSGIDGRIRQLIGMVLCLVCLIVVINFLLSLTGVGGWNFGWGNGGSSHTSR
jgi:hypothetical protein